MATPEKKPAQAGGEMDQDTKEILADMEAEGIDTSTLTGGEAQPGSKELQESETETEEESEEEAEESDDDESEDEEEDDEEESESESETEGDDADEGEEESEDDEDEEEEGEQSKDGKKGKLSLIQKYRKTKKLLRDTQTALTNLQQAKSDEAFDAELKTFAEKSNLNIEVARGLIDFAARKAQLPKSVLEDIQRSRAERRNTEYWQSQHTSFDKDFNSNVSPVLQQLGKTAEEIAEVYQTLNADEKSPLWAWDKRNKNTSLVKLALTAIRGDKKPNRTSSEGGTGSRAPRGKGGKEVSDMTGEDINDMSDDEFDKFSDGLAKNSKSVVHRS